MNQPTSSTHTSNEQKSTLNFEEAFARLEQILEKMNSGNVSLDQSLNLYEEADRLIQQCDKRLNEAEKKIEVLVKNRNGDVQLGTNARPMTQEFSPQQQPKNAGGDEQKR